MPEQAVCPVCDDCLRRAGDAHWQELWGTGGSKPLASHLDACPIWLGVADVIPAGHCNLTNTFPQENNNHHGSLAVQPHFSTAIVLDRVLGKVTGFDLIVHDLSSSIFFRWTLCVGSTLIIFNDIVDDSLLQQAMLTTLGDSQFTLSLR